MECLNYKDELNNKISPPLVYYSNSLRISVIAPYGYFLWYLVDTSHNIINHLWHKLKCVHNYWINKQWKKIGTTIYLTTSNSNFTYNVLLRTSPLNHNAN